MAIHIWLKIGIYKRGQKDDISDLSVIRVMMVLVNSLKGLRGAIRGVLWGNNRNKSVTFMFPTTLLTSFHSPSNTIPSLNPIPIFPSSSKRTLSSLKILLAMPSNKWQCLKLSLRF